MSFKTLYHKYPYLFNLLFVLVLLEIIRTLDWLAWLPPTPGYIRIMLLEQLFEYLSLLPFVLLMIVSYTWAIKKRRMYLLIVMVLVFAIFGPTLLIYFSSGLETVFWHRANRPRVTMDTLRKYTPGLLVAILFLSATYYLTRLQLRLAKQTDEMHKAENLSKEVQLKMLHYQISPHFLFNVLNSIHALIDENRVKAKKLVVEMSDYYRYSLKLQEQTITIEKEIQSIGQYLEIQKTRFEEEFEYDISVDEAARTVLIPSFVIHLLVENAIKHGFRPNEQKFRIGISVGMRKNLVTIRVANKGSLAPSHEVIRKNMEESGHSIGNIKSRLDFLYDGRSSFSLTEENGLVLATIELILPAGPGSSKLLSHPAV
jgi:sensor histidine kinase YesM